MAFEVRAEFWKLSDLGAGVDAVILDEAVADAESWTSLQDGVALPAEAQNGSYAMSVYAVSGNSFIEVSADPAKSSGVRARALYEGKEAWFIVNSGDKVWVAENA